MGPEDAIVWDVVDGFEVMGDGAEELGQTTISTTGRETPQTDANLPRTTTRILHFPIMAPQPNSNPHPQRNPDNQENYSRQNTNENPLPQSTNNILPRLPRRRLNSQCRLQRNSRTPPRPPRHRRHRGEGTIILLTLRIVVGCRRRFPVEGVLGRIAVRVLGPKGFSRLGWPIATPAAGRWPNYFQTGLFVGCKDGTDLLACLGGLR